MENLNGNHSEYGLNGYKFRVYSDISDIDNIKLFFIHDGEIFTKIENNILGKLDDNMKNIVVVAIKSNDRLSDYTPWEENDPDLRDGKVFGGKGDDYLNFIVSELKPFLEKELNVDFKKENTFLGGASLGGLISLYGMLEYPEEFGGGILVSSSFWYDNFTDYLKSKNSIDSNLKIYMDMGDAEGKGKITLGRDNLLITKEVYKILIDKGILEDNIEFIIQEGMTHNSTFFIDRIYDGIVYLYNK